MANKKHKDRHIDVCVRKQVSASRGISPFDVYSLEYNALPEIDLKDIDTNSQFLDWKLSAPLIINSMTGGSKRGGEINVNLARAAQSRRVALFLGSAKIALKDKAALKTFQVRKHCADIPLFANLGLADLEVAFTIEDCRELVKSVEADGLVFYINPLHEALQPDGNTSFRGLTEKLRRAAGELGSPVVVKEVGNGLSPAVVKKLNTIKNISAIDISGAGGTDWAMVEMRGHKDGRMKEICRTFSGYGSSAAEILDELGGKQNAVPLIASGGVRTGVDIVKSICLGASAAAMALPFLEPAGKSADDVAALIDRLATETRIAMFCAGALNLGALNRKLLTKN